MYLALRACNSLRIQSSFFRHRVLAHIKYTVNFKTRAKRLRFRKRLWRWSIKKAACTLSKKKKIPKKLKKIKTTKHKTLTAQTPINKIIGTALNSLNQSQQAIKTKISKLLAKKNNKKVRRWRRRNLKFVPY